MDPLSNGAEARSWLAAKHEEVNPVISAIELAFLFGHGEAFCPPFRLRIRFDSDVWLRRLRLTRGLPSVPASAGNNWVAHGGVGRRPAGL